MFQISFPYFLMLQNKTFTCILCVTADLRILLITPNEWKLNCILNYHFPERYHGAFYGQNVFPFRTVNGPFHIISFESDDSLYVFNNSLNSLKKYPCRSRYQRMDFISFDTSFYNSDNRVD